MGTVIPQPTPPAPRRLGRPTKFNAAIQKQICDSIADGMPVQYAAALAGVSHETFFSWQRRFMHFRAAVEEARAKGLETKLKTIRESARTDWRAAAWYCEHVFPESYSKSRLEITGADGSALSAGNVLIYLPQKEKLAMDGNGEIKPAIVEKSLKHEGT